MSNSFNSKFIITNNTILENINIGATRSVCLKMFQRSPAIFRLALMNVSSDVIPAAPIVFFFFQIHVICK
jgi:hypothetical protein